MLGGYRLGEGHGDCEWAVQMMESTIFWAIFLGWVILSSMVAGAEEYMYIVMRHESWVAWLFS